MLIETIMIIIIIIIIIMITRIWQASRDGAMQVQRFEIKSRLLLLLSSLQFVIELSLFFYLHNFIVLLIFFLKASSFS